MSRWGDLIKHDPHSCYSDVGGFCFCLCDNCYHCNDTFEDEDDD